MPSSAVQIQVGCDRSVTVSRMGRCCPRCAAEMRVRSHELHDVILNVMEPARGELVWVCVTPSCDCCELVEMV
jgi:hypothetical protein